MRWFPFFETTKSRGGGQRLHLLRGGTKHRLINSGWIQPPCLSLSLSLSSPISCFRSTLSSRFYYFFATSVEETIYHSRVSVCYQFPRDHLLLSPLLNFLTTRRSNKRPVSDEGGIKARRSSSPTGNLTWRKSMNAVKIRSSGAGVSSFRRINWKARW